MTDDVHALRAETFLRRLGTDPLDWVRPGEADHDVLVVGGGQAGLAIGFALRRAGIARHTVIDAAGPRGKGVWTTIARMRALRTPKAWPEPELGHPELSFRAWYEDEHGLDAYLALDRIPRLDWAAYVDWLEEALRVPVRHHTRLVSIEPGADHVVVTLEETAHDGTTRQVRETARQLVLANGVEGTGGPAYPAALTGLPAELVAHTNDVIDFSRLEGRRVAVIGAGASALDAAGVALESGAAEVHLFTRRPELLLQGPAGFGPPRLGARDHYRRRSDADRWRQKVAAARQGRSATLASLERSLAFEGFHVHLSAPWHAASVVDGRIVAETGTGTHTFDAVIAGTGYQYDPRTRAELAAIADDIALWGDRYEPPADLAHDDLATHPYLGPELQLLEKVLGTAPWLARIRVFSAAAALSFGYPIGDVQSLAPLVPVLVDGVSRDLFLEDLERPDEAAPAAAAPSPSVHHRALYEHVVWQPDGAVVPS